MSAGKPFRIVKTPTDAHHSGMGTGILSHADLNRPSCPACYLPGFVEGYCARCAASGAEQRHRENRAREAS